MAHLYTNDKVSLLVLMQLSAVEYEHYKVNIIHITGIYHKTQKSQRDRVTHYSEINYGTNVRHSKKSES